LLNEEDVENVNVT